MPRRAPAASTHAAARWRRTSRRVQRDASYVAARSAARRHGPKTWELIRDVVPEVAYLAGGTAVAVHLRHRVSRDLDFFLAEPADLEAVRRRLTHIGTFAPTLHSEDTLNGLFSGTKLQFLGATDQIVLEPCTTVEGLRIAGLGDLPATKLKVIGDRGELRDYYDTKIIETQGGWLAEEGLGLFVRRYRPRDPDAAVRHPLPCIMVARARGRAEARPRTRCHAVT